MLKLLVMMKAIERLTEPYVAPEARDYTVY